MRGVVASLPGTQREECHRNDQTNNGRDFAHNETSICPSRITAGITAMPVTSGNSQRVDDAFELFSNVRRKSR